MKNRVRANNFKANFTTHKTSREMMDALSVVGKLYQNHKCKHIFFCLFFSGTIFDKQFFICIQLRLQFSACNITNHQCDKNSIFATLFENQFWVVHSDATCVVGSQKNQSWISLQNGRMPSSSIDQVQLWNIRKIFNKLIGFELKVRGFRIENCLFLQASKQRVWCV